MSTYQPMTRPVRALLVALKTAYGTDPDNRPMQDRAEAAVACLEAELAALQEHCPDHLPTIHVDAGNAWWAYRGTHLFHFGAYGDTHVLAFGALDDALESAAAVLLEVAPGHFQQPEWPANVADLSESELADVDAAVTADLTYTESGYIISHEWTVSSFDDLADVAEFAAMPRF